MKYVIVLVLMTFAGSVMGATPTLTPTTPTLTPTTPTPILEPRPGIYYNRQLPYRVDENGTLYKIECTTDGILQMQQ